MSGTVVPITVGFVLGGAVVAAILGEPGADKEDPFEGRVWSLVALLSGLIVSSMILVGGELLYWRYKKSE